MAPVLSPRGVSPPSRRAPVLLLAAKPGERRPSPRRPERVKGRKREGGDGALQGVRGPHRASGAPLLCAAQVGGSLG